MGGGKQPPRRVAAVCLRSTSDGIQVLLVRSSGGRWTFPKGRISGRLGPALSAAREALEEAGAAGAIGAIGEEPFATYEDCKRDGEHGLKAIAVHAFLLRVTAWNARAAEDRRNPTWMNLDDARSALSRSRPDPFRSAVVAIVDQAALHIQRGG